MARKKTNGSEAPLTTAQALGSLIKSARDIMRKDKGLNGDLDRLPLLTWIMFLKFLDDLERQRAEEEELARKKFRPAIEAPYRWRDWAADPQGITGDALLAFINQDETRLPNGKRGAGLFAYLRGLTSANGDNRRDVIATVFRGVDNRMKSGYLLRDVINKVADIHFTSSDELHTLGALYETMLREMRDAAGDSGEFYTPRPVVRFMVEVTDPRLGETVLDPATGTGGFLVETFNHFSKQVRTVADRKRLQTDSIFGCEPKSLPYLLGQMNLLLHGLDAPQIDPGNALRFKLSEIGEKERVDVILTNPPFGGEEEKGIQGNFPDDCQTAETALLFLQLIMRKLGRRQTPAGRYARAAVVVPNGTLYASGVAARIRRQLITHFNLHTVVRLPKGVFEPYADIPTNILFFTTEPRTDDSLWFYEHPIPARRAKLKTPSYSQTDPLQFEEFTPLLHWWSRRSENRQAWRVPISQLEEQDWSLDQKNPRSEDDRQIDISATGKAIYAAGGLLNDVAERLNQAIKDLDKIFTCTDKGIAIDDTLGALCAITKGSFPTLKTPPGEFPFVVLAADKRTANGFQFDGEAVCIPLVSSTGHGHAAIHRIHYARGQFAVANILAAVVVKPDIPLLTKYLYLYLWRFKEEKLVKLMAGTANTSLTVDKLKEVRVQAPALAVQQTIIEGLDGVFEELYTARQLLSSTSDLFDDATTDILRATFAKEVALQ
jgi:type I restriction enzyme M protein